MRNTVAKDRGLHRLCRIFMIPLLLLFSNVAGAQNQNLQVQSLPQPTTSLRTDLFPKSFEENSHIQHFNAETRFESMQYLTPLPDQPELSQSQFLSARLSYAGDTSYFRNVAEVGAGTFFVPGESHVFVQELYTSYRPLGVNAKRSHDPGISIGRRKVAWSEIDAAWNMGVWQPYYETDTLRPEQQGLTGLFLDWSHQDFQVMGFVTPFFIPNMGPTIREQDGALVARTRWRKSPPREAGVGSSTNTLNYKLQVPDTTEVIHHEGGSLMARVGRKEDGFWGSTSVGYKPVNELLVSRNLRQSIATGDLNVVVSPEVSYHGLFAVDAGYGIDSSGVVISYLQDNPKVVKPAEGWALQRLSPLQAIAAGIYWQVPALRTRSVLLKFDYLHTNGGTIEDIVSDGSKDPLSQDQSRLKFTRAIRLRGQGELARISRRPLVAQLSWLYDQNQQGSMLNSELQYFAGKSWAVLAGADFLGVDDEEVTSTGFLSEYRANDRIYGGLSYVF